jgi:hypothetical protein
MSKERLAFGHGDGGKLAVIRPYLVEALRRDARARRQRGCSGGGCHEGVHGVHDDAAFGNRVEYVLRRSHNAELDAAGG